MSNRPLIEAVTSSGSESYGDLIKRIRYKYEEVHKFVRDAAARRRVLLNLTIVAGCCAATLTAAPALGGKTVADWLSVTFGVSSPSWQILCAAAGLCSVVATISVQLLKSHNVEERILRAKDVRSKLEMLEISIAAGEADCPQAVEQYLACIKDASFLES